MFSSNPSRFKGLNFDVRELKQRRFWTKHINWKWGLLLVNIPWSSTKFVLLLEVSLLLLIRIARKFGKNCCPVMKNSHFWLTCLAQNVLASSLFSSIRGGGASTLYKLCKLHGYVLLGFFIWLICDGVASFDLFLREMGLWLQNINFPVLKRCVMFLYFQIRPHKT